MKVRQNLKIEKMAFSPGCCQVICKISVDLHGNMKMQVRTVAPGVMPGSKSGITSRRTPRLKCAARITMRLTEAELATC